MTDTKRVLIFRLSSLGDLVMATAALESEALKSAIVDWVVGEEYSELLTGHPRLNRVWSFRRRSGLGAWLKLSKELADQQYDEVLDLHRTLRTRLARMVFACSSPARGRVPCWRTVSKSRLRLTGYYLFKALWPVGWRPEAWVRKSGRLAGGTGAERPDLRHLALPSALPAGFDSDKKYYCVMPASLWDGKKWPVSRFLEVIQALPDQEAVILGTSRDRESQELVDALVGKGIPHHSGVGKWTIPQVAAVLSKAEAYLGNDTGLGHLAEAVGTRAFTIFGPTVPDMGFGPWRRESRAIGSSLWCRPCGKDGRSCFRLANRYACLGKLESQEVVDVIQAAGPRK